MSEAEQQAARADVAASFQRVAVEHLAERTARALQWAKDAEPRLSCLVVAGGVAANQTVRATLARAAAEAKLPMVCPAASTRLAALSLALTLHLALTPTPSLTRTRSLTRSARRCACAWTTASWWRGRACSGC